MIFKVSDTQDAESGTAFAGKRQLSWQFPLQLSVQPPMHLPKQVSQQVRLQLAEHEPLQPSAQRPLHVPAQLFLQSEGFAEAIKGNEHPEIINNIGKIRELAFLIKERLEIIYLSV